VARPGDIHGPPVRTDRHHTGLVVPADAVVAADPPLGASGGVVGHRRVVQRVIGKHSRGAGPGGLHPVPRRADGDGIGDIKGVAGTVVAADPHLRAGSRVVGDSGVVSAGRGPGAISGDVHRAAVRADRHRAGYVIAVGRTVVAADPQP